MDIVQHNKQAWTNEVEIGNQWTRPVDPAAINDARNGVWNLLLTPTIFVPREWFGEIKNKEILCLASGGGQQGPILSAAGAIVTVFDNCPAQLEKDKFVAERDGLKIKLVQGDMKDLSAFENGSFDIVFHPVSNCFVENVDIVWSECFRVLKNGGRLLAGFGNPVTYIFDLNSMDNEKAFKVRYKIPYSDIEQLPEKELEQKIKNKVPLEFGHSLDSQIGGQIKAGFGIKGFYEDISNYDLLDAFIKTFIATLAVKN
jgi:SAM-dependent methyltransferase